MSNEERGDVRKRDGSQASTPLDRRVERSRHALGRALVELMRESHFDEITVEAILRRADVGRATFYAHFKDKRDLLLTDAERFLAILEHWLGGDDPLTGRLAPVAELFAHVADVGGFIDALEDSDMSDAVYGLLTGHLARLIARRLALRHAGRDSSPIDPEIAGRLSAAALVELMVWWRKRSPRPDPRAMDEQFHRWCRAFD